MENKTYSQDIRKYIKRSDQFDHGFFKFYIRYADTIGDIILDCYSYPEQDKKEIHVLLSLVKINLITDHYLMMCQDIYIQEKLCVENLKIRDQLRKIIKSNSPYELLKDNGILNQAIKDSLKICSSFDNPSKMIPIMKALKKEDIELLKSFNPFFEEEYNLFAIEITPEYVIKELNQQNDSSNNNNDISQLIIDLFKYDEDLVCELISDIIETLNLNEKEISSLIDIIGDCDILTLSAIISQYYQFKKQTIKLEK